MRTENSSLRETFLSAARLHGEATREGDYKTANKQYEILKKVFEKVKKSRESVDEFYGRLIDNDDASVKIWACAHSLSLGLNVEKAETVLTQLSENKSLGILRLDAEMTLKQWKKRGYLKF